MMEQDQKNILIDVFFRKFYMLWGGILLIFPVAITAAWYVITADATSEFHAQMIFKAAFPLFAYYQFTWFLSVLLSAIPLFFGVRLLSGTLRTRIAGVAMILVSAATLAVSVLRIWSAM